MTRRRSRRRTKRRCAMPLSRNVRLSSAIHRTMLYQEQHRQVHSQLQGTVHRLWQVELFDRLPLPHQLLHSEVRPEVFARSHGRQTDTHRQGEWSEGTRTTKTMS